MFDWDLKTTHNTANVIASTFGIFMSKVFSFFSFCPDVETPFQTAPHPTREASVRIIICAFNWEKVWALHNLRFFIHEINSVSELAINVMTDSLFSP